MSYENAPQTIMLATHCCVCGRPLCDARSVELGIGPECGALQHAASDISEEQRELCNKLTWAASVYATQGKVTEVRKCAQAIRTIGLTGLADAIDERFHRAERNVKITIERRDDDRIWVKTPFRRGMKDEFIAAQRAIPGRRYMGDGWNSFPTTARAQVWRLLIEFFEGDYGPEGVFRVPLKVSLQSDVNWKDVHAEVERDQEQAAFLSDPDYQNQLGRNS
jgi:hypothetical protein